jgi:hypothetical protein
VRSASGQIKPLSKANKAKRRLIHHYPLLGALAASFDIEEDLRLCQQYDIRVAAIDVGALPLIPFPYQSDRLLLCLAVLQHFLRLRA